MYAFSFFVIFQSFTFLVTVRKLSIVDKQMSLKEIIKSGQVFSFFESQDIKEFGKGVFRENLRLRMFNNHELATLFYYKSPKKKNFLYGQLLLNHFIKAIPAIIFKDKKNYHTAETLIITITESPLYYGDTVDSLQSSSYADFGLLGLIIYPMIINLLIFIIYKIITLKQLLNLTAIFILALVLQFITVRVIEINLSNWFVLVRNIVIFILFFNFLLSFVNKEEITKLQKY